MSRLRFGTFLAPFHQPGQNPTLALQRDLELVEHLDRLGFDPDPHEQQIRLRACPFRDAAREHPQVVCAVHRGLIEQLLEPSGTRSRLVPFAEPDLCLVTLEPALAASR